MIRIGKALKRILPAARIDPSVSLDLIARIQEATLLQALSDPVLAVDQEGKTLFHNEAFSDLHEGKDLRGQTLSSLFLDAEVLQAYESALRGERILPVKATPIDLPSGRKFFSVSASPLKGGDDVIYGSVGVFHDVTDLKRAEQIRIDFVANVSHELRTPLTSIKGYADTLIQDLREGRASEGKFLEAITRNVERLMSLIQDLLDLSALDSGEIPHHTSFSTSELTSRVIQQLEGSLARKRQTVAFEAKAPRLEGDPGRIEQVLVNLLDNAHKYTPESGRIHVLWETDAEGAVVLKVTDSGPGIAQEHHARLFERFYRADKARSREMGGTGLGLAIVKHILQRHGGQAWVESELGKGATFVCRFPARP